MKMQKERFKKAVKEEYLADFHDTDWFKEVEPELTPASNLAFYR